MPAFLFLRFTFRKINVVELSKYTLSLRIFRKYHRYIGISIAVILFVSALTGILLSLKKNVDILQPPTQRGGSLELTTWKALGELAEIAASALYEKYPGQRGNPVDRMDVRPSKGIVKVLFKKGWWEVQLDGASGQVKSIARRHSDWIEQLHDGSIISEGFKLVSMNVLGIGVLFMICSGFWLWYGPKRFRVLRRKGKR